MFHSCKKEDLRYVATELGETVSEKATVVQIIDLIKNNDYFKNDIDFVKSLINSTVEERKEEEQRLVTLERTKLERVQAELELARIRSEPSSSQNQSESEFEAQTSLDSLVRSVRTLTVKIPTKPEGWAFFFTSLERAFSAKNVPEGFKAEILLNLLGEKAANVLAYIKDEELRDYHRLKTLVLREFEPTPQHWLDQFRKTSRQTNESYQQFASRLITSWDYYLKLRKVSDFKSLNDLIISDKLFQTLEKEAAQHISIRQANEWFRPTELAKEIDLFYTANGKTPKNNPVFSHKQSNERNIQKVFLSEVKNPKCFLCPSMHPLHKCSSYKGLPVSERVETVKAHRLCFNCLSATHSVRSCKSISCFCGKRHHTTLHFDKKAEQEKTPPTENRSSPRPFRLTADPGIDLVSDPSTAENGGEKQFSATSYSRNARTVLLSTAMCFIRDESRNLRPVRCLLDQGSTSCFLTKDCVQRLGLKKKKVNIKITGINDASFTVRERVLATIANKDNSFVKDLDFLIVPKITEDFIPARKIEINFETFSNIKLADEKFNVPANIEMLLGAEVFYELIRPEQVNIKNTNLVLQNSVFGYIVSGSVLSDSVSNQHCGLIKTSDDLVAVTKKFWEIEEIETELPKNKENEICEKHYAQTYRREQTGRYTVTMPFKDDPMCLGDSKETALKRLNSMWRRLAKDPEYSSLYKSFLKEYEEMGHMREVTEEKEPMTAYYMPHHGVYRPLKTTTKLRVVFNASCPTSKGNSLNSIQYNGGVIQDDIFSLMVRFRKHIYAFTADVEKMYRMINIAPEQRNLQRILWKEGANKPVKIYELATVTYGTVSAPYLAMRTLKQLALDEYEKFPLAAPVVMTDIYMDDIVSGSETLSGAKELQRQLVEIFKSGGMHLHKWCSNESKLNNSDSDYTFSNDEEVKTLGVCWNPKKDNFLFKVKTESVTVHTKRTVLSTIAKLFDPLGLLGPAITTAKIFMQKLWLFKMDWDTPLPFESQREWEKFTYSLQAMNILEIERCILIEEAVHIELHGFADSSEAAYGAVIYAKSLNSKGEVKIKMITSKSRVAPLKKLTIPRLELSAAVLLVKLMKVVQKALKLSVDLTYFWSDSMIVLSWLNKEPHQLKTFVANRVTKIQELSSVQQWRHVPSEENPADLVSRGLEPEKLIHCELWWNGPKFLMSSEYPSKNIPVDVISRDFPNELKKLNEDYMQKTLTSTNSSFLTDFLNFSNSYFKIVRIFSFIFRFLNYCKTREKVSGPLTTMEIEMSEKRLVNLVQREAFCGELNSLEKNGTVNRRSPVSCLHPFIDEAGLLRVGGRIRHSNLNFERKFPILLPANHKFVHMIVEYYHAKYLHCGPNSLLCHLREKFWIVNGRSLCRKVVHRCIKCYRANPKPAQQVMSDLPPSRVVPGRAFVTSGVDYAGPFLVRMRKGRGVRPNKCYVCLFVCFTTKAVHIELVNDLTTEAFLAALKRFASRRGTPKEMHSDRGTNFVGAARVLIRSLNSDPKFQNWITTEKIIWKFNPPAAPHHGGLWEASIKCMKRHLQRTVGAQILTHDEFLTLLAQTEACLNSRPLTPISSDPSDNSVLTPGHFLTGTSLTAVPELDVDDDKIPILKRWKLCQSLFQSLWKRWSLEYLGELQRRGKWRQSRSDIKVNDLVLVKEENLPPLQWKMGRVVRVFPGLDSKIRTVELKTAHGTMMRPITKVCPLPMNE